MSEFLLVFRMDSTQPQASPEEMQSRMKLWMDWLGGIAAQNKLVSAGNRLRQDGNVVKQNNVVTNGPFVEIKEALGGYSIVKADSLAEATTLAHNCPVLFGGGSVEVREIWPID